jgi:predicted transcriptional regulator of viral defense system
VYFIEILLQKCPKCILYLGQQKCNSAVQSIHNQIENKIMSLKKGRILFISDFTEFGKPENVKKVLLRLEKKEFLIRLAHGIYLYPRTDKLLGTLYPSTEEIAIAIAKRDKARIISTGIYALQQLGISTQIPMTVVYLTDGAPRKIQIGKRSIIFKKTSPKNLTIKNTIMNNIVQGLKELGKENVDDDAKAKIKKALKRVPNENLKEDINNAPVWIKEQILALLSEN